MGRGLFGQLNRLVKDVTQRTSDALARQEAALVRGKVTGRAVTDDQGNLLVDAGHTIDDAAIERVAAAGKLHQLVAAAGAARVQDMQEAAREQIGRTGAGQEARAYDSIEEYAEARAYVGRYAGMDVTDVRGNVIIATGKKITEDDVRAARDASLLSALVFAAQQPCTPPEPEPLTVEEPRPGPFSSDTDVQPSPPPRRRLSLVDSQATPTSAQAAPPADSDQSSPPR